MAIEAGTKIQGFDFIDQDGNKAAYPGDFSEEKLVMFFLRHLGCPLCKVTIEELKEAHQKFREKGARVAVIVQSTPKRVSSYAWKNSLPFMLVSDREKRLYNTFEVRRGGLKEFTAPSAFKATVKATLKGKMHGLIEGDEFQVPASFVLGPDGSVEYAYYGKDISDFGSVEELLARV